MSRILSLNLDFVLILQGGLLLLLASASRGLRRDNTHQTWRWFGGYALLQAIRCGLELTGLESSGHPILTLLNDVLLTGSSLLLIEFARASSARPRGRWVHLPLAGSLTLSLVLGGATALAWTGFAVAMLAALWASAAFWQWHGESTPAAKTHPLRQAGLILIACQLLTAIPEQFLYGEIPGLALDLPPIVVRCALFFILTITLVHHQITRENNLWSAEQCAALRRRRNLCGAVIVLIGIAGWVGTDLAGLNQDRMMRQQILARTQIATAAVQAADVSQLYWDERDLTNPAYIRLKALMMAIRHANSDLRFALLVGLREHRAYFFVDSENPDSVDYSPPGQSYDEAAPDYLDGLASGQPFVLGPVTDRWGTWVFGDVPVLDSHGRTLACFELDIAAANWDARIRHARLPVLLITLLIVALVLGAFRAMERLRESSAEIVLSEQRNRSLVEGSPDCVQMFDHTGRYVAVNQNGLRALGLAEADVLGRYFAELWPAEIRPRIDEAVRATISGQPNSFEADYTTPNGRIVTWRVATNPVFDTMGRVRSFVGICVDLTARKQAELAMLAAKKAAEDATQAKSDFLAVMSHEIRTPLSGVIGMLDLLQQCPLEPQPRRYTKFARDSADALLHLLDDALDSAKMEAGKLALETIAFRPHDHFESAFESASMRADSKSLVFRHAVAPSVPAVLIGDPTRLRQIISNLVNNALKFTDKGSVTVTLNAEPIGIGSVMLKIVVTDTGIGISEEARTRLFTKFAQADASTTRHYGGTGLGLSIVKSLAELMGGEVSVTSTPGQGSTFIFSGGFRIGNEAARPMPSVAPAPATPEVAAKSPASPAPAPVRAARPLRILVVDDDVSNRTVAEYLVNNLGHRDVAFALNGREAVDRLIAEKFDVVLMDNRMPVMDGFTATRLIRDPATGATDPAVYIIALTANASTDDRAKCLASGMNDFVTKPVRAPAMADALRRAAEHLLNRAPAATTASSVTHAEPALPAPDGPPPGLSEAELLASLDADEAAAAEAPPEESMTIAPETLEKITAIFFRETPRRLDSMRAAFAAQDATTLGLEAHTLKSNARYLNARRLSELCARIESLADHRQFNDLEPLLGEAEQVYAALRDERLHPLTA